MAYTNWLAPAKNPTELKALYRRLAQQHHPDKGGNTALMQEINVEYDQRIKLFEAGFVPNSVQTSQRTERRSNNTNKTEEYDPHTEWGRLGISHEAWEAYRAVSQIRDTDPYPFGLVVEVIQGKVRVRGKATYPYREILKRLGFEWNSTRRYWFFVKKPVGNKSGQT